MPWIGFVQHCRRFIPAVNGKPQVEGSLDEGEKRPVVCTVGLAITAEKSVSSVWSCFIPHTRL